MENKKTLSSDFLTVDSQPQFTEGSLSGVTSQSMLSSPPPYLSGTNIGNCGNVTQSMQLGPLPSLSLTQHPGLSPTQTFQLDLIQHPPLTQSDQHMSMLWFNSPLRPTQVGNEGHLQNLRPLPPLSEVNPNRNLGISPNVDSVVVTTSDGTLPPVSLTLPSYHMSLRSMVAADERGGSIRVNPLSALVPDHSSLDGGACTVDAVNLEQVISASELQRNSLLSQHLNLAAVSACTIDGLNSVDSSHVYSMAPSQSSNADVLASVSSICSTLAPMSHEDGNNLLQSVRNNIVHPASIDLGSRVLGSGHIPMHADLVPMSKSSSDLQADLERAESFRQAEALFREHSQQVLNDSVTINIPIMRMGFSTKHDHQYLPELSQSPDIPKELNNLNKIQGSQQTKRKVSSSKQDVLQTLSVGTQQSGVSLRPSSKKSRMRIVTAQTPANEKKKMDGLVETVACFKCKLCPFISLGQQGVQDHVKTSHAEAFVSSEESEEDDDDDCDDNGLIGVDILSEPEEHTVINLEPIVNPSCLNGDDKDMPMEPGQDFSNSDDVKIEEVLEAQLESKFLCSRCQKGFIDLESCSAHMAEDHGMNVDKVRLEKIHPNCENVDVALVQEPTSGKVKRPRGRPKKQNSGMGSAAECGDSVKENSTSQRRERLLRTRRKQKLPRKMQNMDDTSEDEGRQTDASEEKSSSESPKHCPMTRLSAEEKKQMPLQTRSRAVAVSLSGNFADSNSSDSVQTSRDIPKITAPLRKRGRPKGSKNTGITALKRKNPKAKIEEQLGSRCDMNSCPIRMKSVDNLDYHQRCHVSDGNGFVCLECHEQFDHWRTISIHLWRVHVIDMELFGCDQCSYKTYSLSKLINMHKRIHSEERPFLCDTCGKGFKTSKQLRNHKVIHMDKRRQRAFRSGECDVCHRYFSDKRMLRVHKDTVHNKLRPFLCNYCGYAASCRSTLKMHMRQHTGEKPFTCDLCEYRTADHNSLRRHKMRHSGEKPYKCPFCVYACIQSSTYKIHLKNKHPGQDEGLMYSCNLCAFRTIKKDNYVTHMADHRAGTIPMNRTRLAQDEGDEKPVIVDSDQTILLPSGTQTVTAGLAHIEGLSANMTAAQVMFSSIEEIRQKLAIAAQSYSLDLSSTDRYPVLVSHLKGEQIDGSTVVHLDHTGQLDPSQIVHHEFLVHETLSLEQVHQLAAAAASSQEMHQDPNNPVPPDPQ